MSWKAPWECRSPTLAGRLCPSLTLPEGPAALGYARKGSPSEIWSRYAHLSLQLEEKQKAAQQFSKLQTAMKVLGISPDEQKACWLILASIYHLGAAGATKGNLQGSQQPGLLERGFLPLPAHPRPAQSHLLAHPSFACA